MGRQVLKDFLKIKLIVTELLFDKASKQQRQTYAICLCPL